MDAPVTARAARAMTMAFAPCAHLLHPATCLFLEKKVNSRAARAVTAA